MGINWDLAVRIGLPLICIFVGWALNRLTERRSKLITYYGHVGTLTLQQKPIHTHVVVIRNVGKKAAANVRISHGFLPDFHIWPRVQHSVEEVPDGGRDILIPMLVPGEQLTINYLYFPPVTFDQVTKGVKSDEGFAQQVSVLLQRQHGRWFQRQLAALWLLGSVTALYLLVSLVIAASLRWR